MTILTFYKVELTSGGPIQVMCGYRMNSSYDGAMVLHASDGKQSGNDFWFHNAAYVSFPKDCGPPFWATMSLDLFMPKQGTVVTGSDMQGYTATFTTDGQDECIAFSALTPPPSPGTRNWRFQSTGGLIAVCMAHTCLLQMKMYTGPFVSTGVHYDVITPPSVYAGQSFWLTVVAIEAAGGTKTDYCGTTSFTSTDPSATMNVIPMDSYNFTWSSSKGPCNTAPNNDGVKIFINVVFNILGMQSLIVSDTVDGSISGLATVLVVGADVKFFKDPKLTVAASGDTVQFNICWSNYSSASGFTFTMTDAVPVGTSYIPEVATNMSCGNTTGVPLKVAFSTSTLTPAPTSSYTEISGTAAADAATRWLRWTVPIVGVQTTGCACFRVTIK